MSLAWHNVTPEDRKGCAILSGVASVIIIVGILGVLVGQHLNPCHPSNIGRCGRRLGSTLQALQTLHSEEATAICPSLVETLDCYYWFSQRCLPDQHFYAKVYVESSAVVDGLCRGGLLVAHGACLRSAGGRGGECSQRLQEQLEGADGGGDMLVDSLYNLGDLQGAFQTPFCRTLRDFILCGLGLVSGSCGLDVALQLQEVQANLTSLLFSQKCESGLRPVLEPPLPELALDALPPVSLAVLGAALAVALLMALLVKRLIQRKEQD